MMTTVNVNGINFEVEKGTGGLKGAVLVYNGVYFLVCTREQMYASGRPIDSFTQLEQTSIDVPEAFLYNETLTNKTVVAAMGYQSNIENIDINELLEYVTSDIEYIIRIHMNGDMPFKTSDGEWKWSNDICNELIGKLAEMWNEHIAQTESRGDNR